MVSPWQIFVGCTSFLCVAFAEASVINDGNVQSQLITTVPPSCKDTVFSEPQTVSFLSSGDGTADLDGIVWESVNCTYTAGLTITGRSLSVSSTGMVDSLIRLIDVTASSLTVSFLELEEGSRMELSGLRVNEMLFESVAVVGGDTSSLVVNDYFNDRSVSTSRARSTITFKKCSVGDGSSLGIKNLYLVSYHHTAIHFISCAFTNAAVSLANIQISLPHRGASEVIAFKMFTGEDSSFVGGSLLFFNVTLKVPDLMGGSFLAIGMADADTLITVRNCHFEAAGGEVQILGGIISFDESNFIKGPVFKFVTTTPSLRHPDKRNYIVIDGASAAEGFYAGFSYSETGRPRAERDSTAPSSFIRIHNSFFPNIQLTITAFTVVDFSNISLKGGKGVAVKSSSGTSEIRGVNLNAKGLENGSDLSFDGTFGSSNFTLRDVTLIDGREGVSTAKFTGLLKGSTLVLDTVAVARFTFGLSQTASTVIVTNVICNHTKLLRSFFTISGSVSAQSQQQITNLFTHKFTARTELKANSHQLVRNLRVEPLIGEYEDVDTFSFDVSPQSGSSMVISESSFSRGGSLLISPESGGSATIKQCVSEGTLLVDYRGGSIPCTPDAPCFINVFNNLVRVGTDNKSTSDVSEGVGQSVSGSQALVIKGSMGDSVILNVERNALEGTVPLVFSNDIEGERPQEQKGAPTFVGNASVSFVFNNMTSANGSDCFSISRKGLVMTGSLELWGNTMRSADVSGGGGGISLNVTRTSGPTMDITLAGNRANGYTIFGLPEPDGNFTEDFSQSGVLTDFGAEGRLSLCNLDSSMNSAAVTSFGFKEIPCLEGGMDGRQGIKRCRLFPSRAYNQSISDASMYTSVRTCYAFDNNQWSALEGWESYAPSVNPTVGPPTTIWPTEPTTTPPPTTTTITTEASTTPPPTRPSQYPHQFVVRTPALEALVGGMRFAFSAAELDHVRNATKADMNALALATGVDINTIPRAQLQVVGFGPSAADASAADTFNGMLNGTVFKPVAIRPHLVIGSATDPQNGEEEEGGGDSPNNTNGFGIGVIVGIAIGAAAGAGVIGFGAVILRRKVRAAPTEVFEMPLNSDEL